MEKYRIEISDSNTVLSPIDSWKMYTASIYKQLENATVPEVCVWSMSQPNRDAVIAAANEYLAKLTAEQPQPNPTAIQPPTSTITKPNNLFANQPNVSAASSVS